MEIEMTKPAAGLDAYDVRHLVTHLELAHREADLHRLLALETDEQKNAWFEAKEAFGDSAGYRADVNRAWRIAEGAYDPQNKFATCANIGRQFYYALVVASLNSLAANVPPGLLSTAVEQGLSTPAQALASIKGLPDEALLAASLAELAPHLHETSLLQEAARTARNISSTPDREHALSALALQWARMQDLSQVEAVLAEIGDEAGLSLLIARLAPLMPVERLPELLARAAQMKTSESQAVAFSALAPYLSPADQAALLKAVQKMRSQRLKLLTSLEILPHLPPPQQEDVLARALKAINSIRNPITCAEIAVALLPHLDPDRRAETLTALIRVIRRLKDGDKRGAAWSELTPFLPQSEQERAFSDILAIKNKRIRAQALEKFAPLLSEEDDLHLAVDTAKGIDVREYLVQTMAAVLPHLSGRLRQSARSAAWKAAREIKNPQKRGQAFGLLAPYLTDAMWRQTLEILQRSRSDEMRAFIIQGIAAEMPGEMLEAALAVVGRIKPGPERAAALAALEPRLSTAGLLPQAMAIAREIADGDARLEALVALAPALAGAGAQIEALEITEEIKDECLRALAMAGLVPRLSRLERRRAEDGIISAVQRIKEPASQARCIARLASRFPRQMLPLALAIWNEYSRAYALLALIPHLPDDLARPVRQEVLETLHAVRVEIDGLIIQVRQLVQRGSEMGWWPAEEGSPEIWRYPSESMLFSERSDVFWRIQDLTWRKSTEILALQELIPLLLAAGFVDQAKEIITLIENDRTAPVWWDYIYLVPYLEEPERTQTIQNKLLARHYLEEFDVMVARDPQRIAALSEIAPQILENHRERILDLIQEQSLLAFLPWLAELGYPREALESAKAIPIPQERAWSLVQISPHLPPDLWPDLLQTVSLLDDDESKALLLVELAPNLPRAYLDEALAAAWQIESPTARLYALLSLLLRKSQFPADGALYPLWRDLLHMLSAETRRDFLSYVPALLPLMVTLCESDQIIKDAVHSLQLVGRFWP